MASNWAMHGSMAGMSDSDPMIMPTTGVASAISASFPSVIVVQLRSVALHFIRRYYSRTPLQANRLEIPFSANGLLLFKRFNGD